MAQQVHVFVFMRFRVARLGNQQRWVKKYYMSRSQKRYLNKLTAFEELQGKKR